MDAHALSTPKKLGSPVTLQRILKELTKDETNDVSSRLCGSSSGIQTTRTLLATYIHPLLTTNTYNIKLKKNKNKKKQKKNVN